MSEQHIDSRVDIRPPRLWAPHMHSFSWRNCYELGQFSQRLWGQPSLDVRTTDVQRLKSEVGQQPPLILKPTISGYLSLYNLVWCVLKIRIQIEELLQEVLRKVDILQDQKLDRRNIAVTLTVREVLKLAYFGPWSQITNSQNLFCVTAAVHLSASDLSFYLSFLMLSDITNVRAGNQSKDRDVQDVSSWKNCHIICFWWQHKWPIQFYAIKTPENLSLNHSQRIQFFRFVRCVTLGV
jgi:hypothetical protein